MITIKQIFTELEKNNIDASAGDSDETTIIVWDVEVDKIKDALKDLHINIIPNGGYGGGTLVYPKK